MYSTSTPIYLANLRKDKYQKNLLCFWVDVKFEGQMRKAEEEELNRQTQLGDAFVKKVPLRLRGRPTGKNAGALLELSDDDDDDDDDDDGQTSATASPASKTENHDAEDADDDDVEDGEGSGDTPSPKRKRRASKGRKSAKRGKKDFAEELPTEDTMIRISVTTSHY